MDSGNGFLVDAVILDRNGATGHALELIYDHIEQLMGEKALEILNDVLVIVPFESIGTDVLLGLLTATLPVKSQLSNRPALRKATEKLIRRRGQYDRRLLYGL